MTYDHVHGADARQEKRNEYWNFPSFLTELYRVKWLLMFHFVAASHQSLERFLLTISTLYTSNSFNNVLSLYFEWNSLTKWKWFPHTKCVPLSISKLWSLFDLYKLNIHLSFCRIYIETSFTISKFWKLANVLGGQKCCLYIYMIIV